MQSWGERLRRAILKDPDAPRPSPKDLPLEELKLEARQANAKERAIGLIAAPLSAAIGFLVIHTLVVNDPPARLADGTSNKLYVNPSIYDNLFLMLIALSLAILITSLLRKRPFMGGAAVLFGLAIFNLHYWGFGVPFVMVGAWYLVRTWRLNSTLKEATAEGPASKGPKKNRRYTPPSAGTR